MIDAKTLCARLGVSSAKLAAWRKRGLPRRGSGKKTRYDPAAVAAWLVNEGLALVAPPAPPRRIVPSASAVAAALKVSERLVFYWKNSGMPVEPDGRYDLEAISAWRAQLGGEDETERAARNRAQTRLAEARAAREEMELLARRQALVDAATVRRLWGQAIAAARAVLEELPESLADELPPETPPAARGKCLARGRERVEQSLALLAEALVLPAEAAPQPPAAAPGENPRGE